MRALAIGAALAALFVSGMAEAQVLTCDVVRATGGQTTAGSKAFHAAGAGFSAKAIGKTISINGAGPAGVNLVTTIATYIGPADVLLVNAASTTNANEHYAWGTDDGPAMNAILATTGTLNIPANVKCGTTLTLTLTAGDDIIGNFGSGLYVQPISAEIDWLGGAAPVMTTGLPTSAQQGIAIANVMVDGMGIATDILDLISVQYSLFQNLYLTDATQFVLYTQPSSACASACGVSNNVFQNVYLDGAGFPNITTSATTNALEMGQGVGNTFDTTDNDFYALKGTYKNGRGINCGFADNNQFFTAAIGRVAGGTGVGVFFQSFASAGQFCKANRFYHVDAGTGGITYDNTNATSLPTQNYLFGVATDSGQGDPLNAGNTNNWYMDGFGNFNNPAGSLRPQNVILQGITVASLPSCAAALKGAEYLVTDQATAASWGGAVTGGGAQTQYVKCNGAAWVQFSPP